MFMPCCALPERSLQSQLLIFDTDELSDKPETVMPEVWKFLEVASVNRAYSRDELLVAFVT